MAPWSPRVADGAPVARPLTRTQVDAELDRVVPDQVLVADVPALLEEHGDPWADAVERVDASSLRAVAAALDRSAG